MKITKYKTYFTNGVNKTIVGPTYSNWTQERLIHFRPIYTASVSENNELTCSLQQPFLDFQVKWLGHWTQQIVGS